MLTQLAGNMPFTFIKGDDFPVSLTITGIDLTKYTHLVEIYDKGSLVASPTVTHDPVDTLSFNISAAVSATLSKAATWRLVLIDANGKRRTFVSGTITAVSQ